MGRTAPIALLLALAACSSSRDTAKVPAAPTPVQATAQPAPHPPPAPPHGSSVQEVNDLFRWLDAQPAAGAAPRRASGAGTAVQPAVIYTIPRANPALLAVVDQEAQQAAYQENLEGCLDGRFPAFCDHAQLTPYDAARVQQAEHEANLATCIDPEWQHLCRPELLPTGHSPAASAPAASDQRTAPAILAPFDAVPGGASIRTSTPTQAAGFLPGSAPSLPNASSSTASATHAQPAAL